MRPEIDMMWRKSDTPGHYRGHYRILLAWDCCNISRSHYHKHYPPDKSVDHNMLYMYVNIMLVGCHHIWEYIITIMHWCFVSVAYVILTITKMYLKTFLFCVIKHASKKFHIVKVFSGPLRSSNLWLMVMSWGLEAIPSENLWLKDLTKLDNICDYKHHWMLCLSSRLSLQK